MKPLIGSAVFGLVPVPPMPGTSAADDRDAHCPDDEGQSAQVAPPLHEAAERMATKEELARLLRELGINVERPTE
jgi:hypothetical protein